MTQPWRIERRFCGNKLTSFLKRGDEDGILLTEDAAAHIQALEEANQILTRASSLSAQDLARVHIRNEARLTARIRQLEEALRYLRKYLVFKDMGYHLLPGIDAALSPAPATTEAKHHG